MELTLGDRRLELVQGDVVQYLQYLLASYEAMAELKGVQLHFIPREKEIFMDFDQEKLLRIVSNLLSNAVKFTPDRGSVQCEARLADGNENIEISVADTGIGIQPDDLKRIFDPFEQVDGSMSRRFEGTGLGLSLTKKFVELHGGRIWAESDGVGKGAAFRFTIPTFPVHRSRLED